MTPLSLRPATERRHPDPALSFPALNDGLDAQDCQAEAITEAVRAGVTGGVATKVGLSSAAAELRGEIGDLRTEFKWIKVIGGAILAVLILPWLAELVTGTLPGPVTAFADPVRSTSGSSRSRQSAAV